MTISKEKIEITTANSIIGMIIGIATIIGIFSSKIDAVSERTAKLETAVPLIQADVSSIKTSVSNVPDLVRLVKHAYPNY